MLTLINTNTMVPPIAPVGLDYIAAATRPADIETHLLDLSSAGDGPDALERYFAENSPMLVGLSFRNADDCFWPSATWFVPELVRTVERIRKLTDAPIVLGGVGYSIFAARILAETGADFGVHGDGEWALAELYRRLRKGRDCSNVPGLLWRDGSEIRANPPAWPAPLRLPTSRDAVDNAAYLRLGGQIGLETKRGCDRRCAYCADPLAKGPTARCREPGEVAEEVENLLAAGVDVLHLCDGEFNIPREHALAVCRELDRRDLGSRVLWYTYMAVTPFDAELAAAMRRAGCVGIDFTADSASERMLRSYGHPHRREDIATARRLCREHGITAMFDLLLGGPGETPETIAETIAFFKSIDPDCVGAALGVRVYEGTAIAARLTAEPQPESNPGIRRRYDGPLDLARPTFYISPELGERPAELVRELIAGDKRFFEPAPDAAGDDRGYNYNDNEPLVRAIADGARGAYWDILRKLR
ncbi:MAG: B12-binding domain-containing radical SAM protein [Phycisphaerae bacterium]